MYESMEHILEAFPKHRKELAEAYAKRLENIRLTPRNKLALRLWVAGVKKEEVVRSTGINPGSFDMLRVSKVGKMYIQLVTAEHEERFKLLFGKVVNYLEDGLNAPDFEIKDKAARLWAGMAGKLIVKHTVERSAEDNVQDLIEGKVIELTEEKSANPVQTGDREALSDSE